MSAEASTSETTVPPPTSERKFKAVDILDDDIPESEIQCTVCGLLDGFEDDPIVICDGCKVAVHAKCYDIPLEDLKQPEWRCRPCLRGVQPRTPDGRMNLQRQCRLCGHIGGALSELSQNGYVHTCCAAYIPEIEFVDGYVEVSKIKKNRFKGTCMCCSQNVGAVMTCGYPNCELMFHLYCAVKNLFLISSLPHPSLDCNTSFLLFCPTHSSLLEKLDDSQKCVCVVKDRLCCCTLSDKSLWLGALPVEDVLPLKNISKKQHSSRRGEQTPYKSYPDASQALLQCLHPHPPRLAHHGRSAPKFRSEEPKKAEISTTDGADEDEEQDTKDKSYHPS